MTAITINGKTGVMSAAEADFERGFKAGFAAAQVMLSSAVYHVTVPSLLQDPPSGPNCLQGNLS